MNWMCPSRQWPRAYLLITKCAGSGQRIRVRGHPVVCPVRIEHPVVQLTEDAVDHVALLQLAVHAREAPFLVEDQRAHKLLQRRCTRAVAKRLHDIVAARNTLCATVLIFLFAFQNHT